MTCEGKLQNKQKNYTDTQCIHSGNHNGVSSYFFFILFVLETLIYTEAVTRAFE